jgi:galactan 5-O-arabinofuranosyltransferase
LIDGTPRNRFSIAGYHPAVNRDALVTERMQQTSVVDGRRDNPTAPAAQPDLPPVLDEADVAPLTTRRIGRTLGEMALATVVTIVVSLGMQFVIDRLHIPRPSYVTLAMATLVGAALLVAALLLVSLRRFPPLAKVATWAGIAALNTAVLAFMLQGSKFYLGGISSDQSFRTEYLTRLTDSAHVADYAFPGLPSYYPSGWFWLGGRFADLFGLAGWAAYKPFAILTISIGSVLGYVAWTLVVSRRRAVLLSLAVSSVGVATWAAYEPYAWLFGALIPPMAAVAWVYLVGRSNIGRAGDARWAPGLLLGAYIGLLALCYTLLFVFFVLVTVLTAVVAVVLDRRSGRRGWPAIRPPLLRLLVIGLPAAVVASVHWGPYLAGSVGTPVKQSAALSILPPFGAQFPVPIGLGDFVGLLSLAGLVWALVRLRDNVVARAFVVVIGAAYLWYGLSMLGIPARLTLLPYKIELVLDETLRCAGVLAILDGARWLYRRIAANWRRTTVLAVCVVCGLGAAGVFQNATGMLDPLPGNAYQDYYPTGYTANGQRDVTQNGAWNAQLHDAISAMSGKPEHDLVVLSGYQEFLSFWPYWNFEPAIIEYANPLADFYTRADAITDWAKSTSPARLADKLAHSQFRAPDVFVLTRQSDGLHMKVTRNIFPVYPQIDAHDVVFPTTLFDSPAFAVRDVGPFTVIVRH